jgi:hypothetical protein
MFIPDPIFSIPDPRSRDDKILDLGSRSVSKKKNLTQKTDSKFSKIG